MTAGERRFSAVVPVYNGAATLADTLESIRRQTVRPAEVLVVDDGSDDASVQIAQQHPLRPRVISLGANHGVAYARNVGLREASGEFIAFLDQDDLWLPRRLEVLGAACSRRPEWRLVVTDEVAFGATEDQPALEAMNHPFLPWIAHWRPRTETLGLLNDLAQPAGILPDFEVIPPQRILSGSVTVTTSYLLDRELAMACGGFAAWLRSADDWILLQTMSRYTPIVRLIGPSVLYRIHPTNTSTVTDWPMPLMVSAAAVRLGGSVVSRGGDRDPEVVGALASSPFLQHMLSSRAAAPGWRARADAVAAWQLLATDRNDRLTTGRQLARSLAAATAPPWLRFVGLEEGYVADALAARAVAFYLPQFHPIPENDAWWGPGFTEWTNVAKARPLYPGHRQPTLPADLGFYDLRLPQVREAQSGLAEQYGVEAFCYWHYWFGGGRRVLETPFSEVLASGEPSVSFCLGWANQTWTGIWHGAADRVLMEQTYPGPEDDKAHFDAVVAAFRDDRYLRVDGLPVFYVFRPEELPDAAAFVDRWQAMARAAGLEGLYLVAESSDLLGRGAKYVDGTSDGFDSSVYIRLPVRTGPRDVAAMRARRKLLRGLEVYPYSASPVPLPDDLDPDHYVSAVYPNWDNTPRSGRRGLAIHGASPERFRPHVRAAVDALQVRPADERLLWIKSWNEWAEGNHLEPDLRFGRDWLRVLHEELTRER